MAPVYKDDVSISPQNPIMSRCNPLAIPSSQAFGYQVTSPVLSNLKRRFNSLFVVTGWVDRLPQIPSLPYPSKSRVIWFTWSTLDSQHHGEDVTVYMILDSFCGRVTIYYKVIDYYFTLLSRRNYHKLGYPTLSVGCQWFSQFRYRYDFCILDGWDFWVSSLFGNRLNLVFNQYYLLFPILYEGHYTVAVVDLMFKVVLYYDPANNVHLTHQVFFAINYIMSVLFKMVPNECVLGDWSQGLFRFMKVGDGPVQRDNYNCGVFISQWVEQYCRGRQCPRFRLCCNRYRLHMLLECSLNSILPECHDL